MLKTGIVLHTSALTELFENWVRLELRNRLNANIKLIFKIISESALLNQYTQ